MQRIYLIGSNQYAIVDHEDFDRVNQYDWYEIEDRNTSYAITYDHPRWRRLSMHKLVAGYKLTDHKNSNGLDNRKQNLREATATQNSAHRTKPKVGQSQYKGVRPLKSGLWKACIGHNYKSINLGTFTTEMEAAQAYDEAALELWGEFAKLNFPRL
jgi:hypothetical protein